MDNLLVGPFAGDGMTAQTNCVVIGDHAQSDKSDCIVFGDYCHATEDGEVVVGNRLFGEPIPNDVQDMIRAYPIASSWLIRFVWRKVFGS